MNICPNCAKQHQEPTQATTSLQKPISEASEVSREEFEALIKRVEALEPPNDNIDIESIPF